MVNVGLIGAGVMGTTHQRAYQQLEEVQLAAVCDLDLAKAQALADAGVKVTADYREILEDPEIDVIDVCLPTYLHKEVVIAAAEAGKHVFCEKPIALSIEDGEEMIQACRKAGVKLGVGHVVRFFPDYYKVKDIIGQGHIGDPKVIRTSRGGAFPSWPADNWYADYSKSGGPIVDLIIHDFDWLMWLFGPVQRVLARTVNKPEQGLDHALAVLRFENGNIAHVEGSWAQPAGTPFTTSFEIAGTKGLYEYSKDDAMPLVMRTATKTGGSGKIPESPLVVEPYTAQLAAFFQAVINDEEVPVSGEDGVKALGVALAAKKSAETGEVVWLGGSDNDQSRHD